MTLTANSGYLDCFSGISGDMLLGALLDSGLDEAALRSVLAGLKLEPFELNISRQTSQAIAAVSVRISSVK